MCGLKVLDNTDGLHCWQCIATASAHHSVTGPRGAMCKQTGDTWIRSPDTVVSYPVRLCRDFAPVRGSPDVCCRARWCSNATPKSGDHGPDIAIETIQAHGLLLGARTIRE